jgi:hypothetical protein
MTDKRYFVDFYDMFDGWSSLPGWYGEGFDDLNEAKKFADEKMKTLDASNKRAGEHYGVIDRTIMREVYCTLET